MLYTDDYLIRLRHLLKGRLEEWGFSPDATLRLINISENATFLAEEGDRRLALRAYRHGYHTAEEIRSELAWIAALRAEGLVATPAPMPGADGALLREIAHEGAVLRLAAFAFIPGRSPAPHEDLTGWFHELGAISARLHAHARGWARPAGFTRKSWTVETMLGRDGHWGDWRHALGLDAEGQAVLERAQATIAEALTHYGQAPHRFGLIHGDLRLANLLVDGRQLRVIDFDDCGFSWNMYDFAAAVSFFEHEPVVADLATAWVAGYRGIALLTTEDEAILPALVLLRRMLLLAWVASHAETPTAQEMGAGYTEGAVAMAARFLSAAGKSVLS